MFAKLKSEKLSNNKGLFFDYIKGLVIAIIISLGLVVLFAFILKWASLPDNIIPVITLVIKDISVVIGSLFAVKGESKGLVKGAGFGIIYVIFAFLLFSMLAGSFSMGLSSLLDIISASVLGSIVGIVKVNRKQA